MRSRPLDAAVEPGYRHQALFYAGLGDFACLNEARYGVLWGAMGAARSCYETALDYAKTRVQFGRAIAGYVRGTVTIYGNVARATHGESVEDRERDQIDYSTEEPWIREKFEGELAARGIKSDMPEDAYRIRDVHATILHQMGLSDLDLTYYNAGRNMRLTDTGGRVIRPVVG